MNVNSLGNYTNKEKMNINKYIKGLYILINNYVSQKIVKLNCKINCIMKYLI